MNYEVTLRLLEWLEFDVQPILSDMNVHEFSNLELGGYIISFLLIDRKNQLCAVLFELSREKMLIVDNSHL